MPDDLFAAFDPIQDGFLQILDPDGAVVRPEWKPAIPDPVALDAYRRMLLVRTADQMAVSYQRQGRMYTYPPNYGQEAIGVTAGLFFRPEDWLVPAYRELGAWLAKGATLKDVFLLFGGHEDGSRFPGAPNMLPTAVPIASQLLHAAGIGYALRLKQRQGVVFTFFGDGGTSEGDFHEALNFAGVWQAPVIFICQNNQYAISCPRSRQTAARSLAVKAVGYGLPGLQVDGNDFFALYAAVEAAASRARSGGGPALIEAVTYRRGAHTTSDDPTRYRSDEEERLWEARDPLRRLRLYLAARDLWREPDDEPLLEQYKREIDAQFTAAEDYPPYRLEDVFQYHYQVMPAELDRQLAAYRKFQDWKESRS